MFASEFEDTIPLEPSTQNIDDVNNIGPVKPFTPGDKELRPDQLFRRQHPGFDSHDRGGWGTLNPQSIHGDYPILHSPNQNDEITSALRPREANRDANFERKALLPKLNQNPRR